MKIITENSCRFFSLSASNYSTLKPWYFYASLLVRCRYTKHKSIFVHLYDCRNNTSNNNNIVSFLGNYTVTYYCLPIYLCTVCLLCAFFYEVCRDFSFSPDPTVRYSIWATVFGGAVSTLALYVGNQSMIQRYISIKNTLYAQMYVRFPEFLSSTHELLFLLLLTLIYFLCYFSSCSNFTFHHSFTPFPFPGTSSNHEQHSTCRQNLEDSCDRLGEWSYFHRLAYSSVFLNFPMKAVLIFLLGLCALLIYAHNWDCDPLLAGYVTKSDQVGRWKAM